VRPATSHEPRARDLPAELTSFVGRREDLAAIRQLSQTARLVTLTGIGGVGKSRLALRVAGDLRRAFADGVWLVELDDLDDPALLAHTVADALGTGERSTRAPIDVLCDHLSSRNALLILDSCEHLVVAVAALADQVLRAAPDLKILATSRQALRIAGEHIYPVSPLAAPPSDSTVPPGGALQFPAVALLAERAAAAVPGFTITPDNEDSVVRLCQHLDGVPLAIELAAVRLRALTVDELVGRLDDRFGVLRHGSRNLPLRHQTLQALVDWSHELCSPREQLLWARASVFAGGFTVDAIEAVCTDDSFPATAVLDTVTGLLDKSIVVRDEHDGQARFRMLDTLRAYGASRLIQTSEHATVIRRHRDWCRALLVSAEREWIGPRQEACAARLQLEHANLRRALEYCTSTPGEGRVGLQMAAVPWLWAAMGHLSEGALWLDRVLAIDSAPSRERAWALTTAAYIACFLDDEERLATLPDQAYQLALRLDDPRTLAYTTHVLGTREMVGDDPASAIPLLTDALDRYAELEMSPHYTDSLRIELAAAHLFVGAVDEAATLVDELYDQCVVNGDRWNLSYALWGRGYVCLMRGELDQAETDLIEALTIKRPYRDMLGFAFTLELLAWTAAARRESIRAATLLGSADALWQKVVGTRHLWDQRTRFEAIARADLTGADFDAAFQHGREQPIEDCLSFALRDRTATTRSRTETTTSELSRRERQVAALVAEGLSNKDIAARLVISLRTAEGHVERVLAKLGFKSRTQVASWVVQQDSVPET
jgi:non-specific serine/threonine protein kinase